MNYAEAVRTRHALDENQNRQEKYLREERHTEAVRMRPALDEKQNRQNPKRNRILDGSKSWQVPNGTIGNAKKNKISDQNEGWKRRRDDSGDDGRKRDLNVKSGWQKPSVTIIGDWML